MSKIFRSILGGGDSKIPAPSAPAAPVAIAPAPEPMAPVSVDATNDVEARNARKRRSLLRPNEGIMTPTADPNIRKSLLGE